MASTIDSGGGGGSAAGTTFAPDGDIAATDVQAAIVEVRDDTDGKLSAKADASTTITAGAGLTGGGDLSTGRTVDVVANADGSIVVNANDVQVGVLASDAQHGARGGGTQHAAATTSVAGFMSAADKTAHDAHVAHVASTANPHSTDLGNLGGGTLAELNALVSDATLDDSSASRTPSAHATSHERDGSDPIDGDHLDITYTPTNYTPSTTPAEAAHVDDLAAHLAGIDVALSGGGAGGNVNGPLSSTDNAVPRFDGTGGDTLQNSTVTIDDTGNLSVAGNITLTGTVDGRDVATDGAKLDGIEAGADVTDATNVAAAGALMADGSVAATAALDLGGFAITNVGAVDGRDLSVDGAKLDGIEAGATADQTAAEVAFTPNGDITAATVQAAIVEVRDDTDAKLSAKADDADLTSHTGNTANPHGTDIGNLGSGTLAELNAAITDRDLAADATKLDGIEASADVTDATNVAAAGALMTSGGTMTGALAMGANAITTSSTVDGRDVSADGATLDAHVASTANPHGTDLGNLGSGTLAELNAAVTDATLDDASSARTPTSHAVSHISGGSDEIDGDQIDIDWNPTNYTPTTAPTEATSVDHLTAHLAGIDAALVGGGGGGDVSGPGTSTDNTLVRFDGTAGDTIQGSGITVDDSDNLTGVGTINSVSVTAHAVRHERGGADEIDGDHLDIDFTPTNYTPTTAPAEAANVDDLAAHLAGIDTALGSVGGGGGPTIAAISGLSTSNYYSPASGTGQLNALGANFTMVAVVAPDVSDASGFNRRHICGTRDSAAGSASGGGASFYITYGAPFGWGYTLIDGAAAEHQADLSWNGVSGSGTVTLMQQKWLMLSMVKSGASLDIRGNLTPADAVFPSAAAITAGGAFTIGATDQGGAENGLDNGWIHAAAYVNRALSEAELRALYRGLVENGELPDISGSWTAGYRVGGTDPGATWAPFSGSGSLTETGTVVYEGAINNPQWR